MACYRRLTLLWPDNRIASRIHGMLRALKFAGLVSLHFLFALIGTEIVETIINKAFHLNPLAALVWKEWALSIICAALIGFGMWRTWRNDAAKWAWLLPAVWFGDRLLSLYAKVHCSPWLWFQLSGMGCNGTESIECINFVVFTVPFVRGLAYSVGAYVSSAVYVRQTRSSATSAV